MREALVMGQVERGGQISAQMRLWDTLAGEEILGKSYGTDPANWRRIAHIVSDAIYLALTGETGYFDTRGGLCRRERAQGESRQASCDHGSGRGKSPDITSGQSLALTPRFSSNPGMLTYMTYESGNPQVYVLDMASGRQTRVGNVGR